MTYQGPSKGARFDDIITAPRFSVANFGAVSNATAAANAFAYSQALAVANAAGGELFFPMTAGGGNWLVSSTFAMGANTSLGSEPGVVVRSQITNGSPVFQWAAGSQLFAIKNMAIVANAGSTQNCIGVKFDQYCNRWLLSNTRMFGLATGYDITGFIGTGVNVWAHYCTLGFRGTALNGSNLNLRFENNPQDFIIWSSRGLLLPNMMTEGLGTNALWSTFDNCYAVTIETPYFEADAATPRPQGWIKVGGATICNGFRVRNGYMSGAAAGAGIQNGVYAIALDRIADWDIQMHFLSGTVANTVSSTGNTGAGTLNGASLP